MSYSLITFWHDRQRYLPAVLAVAFSALLVALQCGLLLGTLSVVSVPIDRTSAHIWLGSPGVSSVEAGCPIPEAWSGRLNLPGIERVEPYLQGVAMWHKPAGDSERCIVVGSRLHEDALGAVDALSKEMRGLLAEPGAVVVAEADLNRLGLCHGAGELAEVSGRRVRVVGLLRGFKGLGGAYVFCSLETARALLHLRPDQTSYLLARCERAEQAPALVERLGHYPDMSASTSSQFSTRSRRYWLFKTGAGIALGLAAVLGLIVGAVVTSQTLYAATAASLREYAVLRALGIPRWRLVHTVVALAFWVGTTGVGLALPITLALAPVADALGAKVDLPRELLASTGAVTLTMALLSGLTALASLRRVEPAALLR
jgi:putative ABC transport system permease protein